MYRGNCMFVGSDCFKYYILLVYFSEIQCSLGTFWINKNGTKYFISIQDNKSIQYLVQEGAKTQVFYKTELGNTSSGDIMMLCSFVLVYTTLQ